MSNNKSKKKIEFIKYTRIWGILFLTLLAIVLVSYEIFDNYKDFSDRANTMREKYFNKQKEIVKNEVYKIVNLIRFEKSRLNTVDNKTKKEWLKYISNIRFGKEGYIFVNKFNGVALVSNGKLIPGNQKLWEAFSTNAEKVKEIFDMELKAAQNPDGDYIYYSFVKLTNSNIESPKVSFIYGLKDFNWIIGAGVYLDDIEQNIAILQKGLRNKIITRVIYSLIFLTSVIAIFLIIFRIFSSKISEDFKEFNLFFKETALNNRLINLSKIRFKEFNEVAENINKTLNEKMLAQKALIEEREQLLVTLRSIGDGLITTDNKGKVVLMNNVAEKLTGWTNEDARGKELTEIFRIIDETTKKEVENPVIKVLEKGETVELSNHTVLISKNGSKYNIGDSAAPIKDAEGKISGVVLVFRDVTEQYKMRETLKKSESFYRNIFEYSNDVVSIFDKDGTIVYQSPSHKNILGYEKETFIGKNIFSAAIHPEDHEMVKKYLAEGLKNPDKVYNIHFRVFDKEGKIHYMEGTGRNLIGIPSINGIIVNYRDVTERFIEERKRNIFQNLTHQLSQPLSINSLAKIVSQKAYELFNYDAFSFDVVIESKNILFGIYNEDKDETMEIPQQTETRTLKLSEVKNKDVIFEGKSKLLNYTDSDERESFHKFGFSNRLSKSLMFVPIKYMEKIVGILSIQSYSSNKYSQSDLKLFEDFTAHIGGAVIRLKTEEQLRENELRLKTLINATPDIICFKDGEGRWLVANNSDLELFSLKNVDYFGKTDAELAKYTAPIFRDAFNNCLETDEVAWRARKISRKEEIIPTINGEVKVFDVIKSPIFNEDGSRKGLVVLGRDITIRKKAEQQLEILSRAIEQSPVSIIITNLKGEIEYVNPKFTQITGYTFEDALNHTPNIIKSGAHDLEFYKELWDTITSGKTWRGEFQNKKKNGEIFWEIASISPIFNKQNEIEHFVAVKEDITEKKDILREMIKAKENAENADKMKSIFLAQMSHEIRTPINALVSMASLLRFDFQDIANEDQLMSFDVIDRAGERIIRTIDLLLNLSEIQAGTYEMSKRKFDLYTEILSTVVAENRKIAETKKIKLNLITKTLETEIESDFYTINQIFIQLIDNAIKYTNKGEVTVKILRNSDNELVVEIKDTGIGIDEAYLPKLFQPFSQEEMGYTRKFEGNGIGMALVNKYCELNNAKIEVESQKGVGSTFRIIFPNA